MRRIHKFTVFIWVTQVHSGELQSVANSQNGRWHNSING